MKKALSITLILVLVLSMSAGFLTAQAAEIKFLDVPHDEYYYTPVYWAVDREITNGTGPDAFSPGEVCTRNQVVTFLWRAAGRPEPASSACHFTDVDPDDYYYTAMLWAVENGITKGTSDTTFAPEERCTRGQIVTFLWRFDGAKTIAGSNIFTDVDRSDYYDDAVTWAVGKEITNGVGNNLFAPNDPCIRAQVVTFLYRYYHAPSGIRVLPYDISSYNGSAELYQEGSGSSFKMMGIDYQNGVVVSTGDYGGYNVDLLFNPDGAYTVLSFDLGHVDGGKGGDGTLNVYLDGENQPTQTVSLPHQLPTTHYTLNITGKNQVRLFFKGGNLGFGLSNVKIDTYEWDTKPGTLRGTLVQNTNMKQGDFLLPYQSWYYNGSTEIFEGGDKYHTFSMMGIDYLDGLRLNTGDYGGYYVDLLYNPGGAFTSFSFDLGHTDGGKSGDGTLYIYLDGEDQPTQTVSLPHQLPTTHYTLNITGKSQIRLLFKGSNLDFALRNVEIDVGEQNSKPGTLRGTLVQNTNMKQGDFLLPYQSWYYNGSTEIFEGDDKYHTFSMMGIKHLDGLRLNTGDYGGYYVDLLYNPGGDFTSFSFDLGHADGGKSGDGTLYIYLDGEDQPTQTVSLPHQLPTTHYTLNITGKSQIRLLFKGSNLDFALTNVALSTEEWDVKPGTLRGTLVQNTNMEQGGFLLPYQSWYYNGSTEVYEGGDKYHSFSMMGVDYLDGLRLSTGDYGGYYVDLLYNPGGDFTSFSFDLGHTDGGKSGDGTLYIYLDGEDQPTQTVSLPHQLPTTHFRLNIAGKSQIRLLFKGSNLDFGLRNVEVSTEEWDVKPGTLRGTLVQNTNMEQGGFLLPYQSWYYNGSTEVYEGGDRYHTFSMMGVDYLEGLCLSTGDYGGYYVDLLYNPGGDFSTFSFDLGHVDGGKNGNGTLYIYLDGESTEVRTISLTNSMELTHVELPISGKSQIRLFFKGSNLAYGLINMQVTP